MVNGNFPDGQPYGYSPDQPAPLNSTPSPQDVLVGVFGHAVGVDPSNPYGKRKPVFLPNDYGKISANPSFTELGHEINDQFDSHLEAGKTESAADREIVIEPARTVLLGIRNSVNNVRLARKSRQLEKAEKAADRTLEITQSVIARSGDIVTPGETPRSEVRHRNRLEVLRGKISHHETDGFYKNRDAGRSTEHSHKTKQHRKFVRKATKTYKKRDQLRNDVVGLQNKAERYDLARR